MADPRWRTDMNWLSGLSTAAWWRLMRANGVDRAYWHRAGVLGALSVYNSAMRRIDAALSGSDFAGVEVPAPLFVLGHWRSGTTWLFQLLAADPRRAAPNAFQVVNPRSFLSTEPVSSRLFSFLVPPRRLQDDVPLSFATPEEDEYAIGLLSGCSPYLGRSFPRRLDHYERFLTLADCTPAEVAAFCAALREFCGRLAVRYDRPLVLKSPAHTGRVRTLLEVFPNARFVHVHRDPYAVFQSTRHLYATVDPVWTLHERDDDADEVILRQYRAVHDAWFADRERIAPERLHELSYEDLVADPVAALRALYVRLDLGDFEPVEPIFAEAAARPYATNAFAPLSKADRARVREVAAPCFAAWGYPA